MKRDPVAWFPASFRRSRKIRSCNTFKGKDLSWERSRNDQYESVKSGPTWLDSMALSLSNRMQISFTDNRPENPSHNLTFETLRKSIRILKRRARFGCCKVRRSCLFIEILILVWRQGSRRRKSRLLSHEIEDALPSYLAKGSLQCLHSKN